MSTIDTTDLEIIQKLDSSAPVNVAGICVSNLRNICKHVKNIFHCCRKCRDVGVENNLQISFYLFNGINKRVSEWENVIKS